MLRGSSSGLASARGLRIEAIAAIKDYFAAQAVPLELVSGKYYHLDTCFVPLSGGEILYYPPAFSKASLTAIRDRVAAAPAYRGKR